MLTRWGRGLDPDDVLPEYPRPQLVRSSYLNLNGWWDYAITALDAGPPDTWDGSILVPFSPEAPLSGVRRQLQPDQLLWYRRTLTLPEGFHAAGQRLLLHFGAVDQSATVWCDGAEVAHHEGGYLPFTADLTDVLGATTSSLVVRVRDLSNNRGPSSGKQRLARGGIWYTAQSGIWQTVWAESVPATYVDRLTLVPLLDDAALEVTVHATSADRPPGDTAIVRVLADGAKVGVAQGRPGVPLRIPLTLIRPWSPDDPFLYDLEVTLGEDRVTSYAGLRTFGVSLDGAGHPRLTLNGEPLTHVGVLDQGYWPDGLMTAPSDAAMQYDIATMKRLGFAVLRKHVKIEPLRWYAHCDRLGMLVWQDLVNGGERYRTAAVTSPGRWPVRLRDTWRAVLGRSDPAGRDQFRAELRDCVETLDAVVSLALWVPFNEGWGQFDARRVAAELREVDPTRLVDHASGWHDQGVGDLHSLHVYGRPFTVPRRRRRDRRALALTEYGGRALAVEGHVWGDDVHGYRRSGSAAELGGWFTALHRDQLGPAVAEGLAATVYTQLSDVEDEVNGLLTYDREVLKLPEELVRNALGRLSLPRPDGR